MRWENFVPAHKKREGGKNIWLGQTTDKKDKDCYCRVKNIMSPFLRREIGGGKLLLKARDFWFASENSPKGDVSLSLPDLHKTAQIVVRK
jgi:hypothetical protein